MPFFRFFLILISFSLMTSAAFAYTDRVDASTQEIFDAAMTCFQKQGISKSNVEKKTLTTKWVYERIRRTRHRKFIPMHLKENVDFRYQIEVAIKEGKAYSEVSVRGWFEEKETDAPPQQPWKRSYSSKELYFKERELFFKILRCLEAQKKAPTAVPSKNP